MGILKFNIAKDDLVKALNTASKGMSSRSTLPILSGVLVEASQDGTLVFQTTDLEISIKHSVSADVIEAGRTVVPGKLFADIVKTLPDAAVTVSSSQDRTQIDCMEASFTLSSLNPADFPYFPEVSASTSVSLPTGQLAGVVKKVGKAVSRDESRAVLTGILFSVEGGVVRLAATDSYRLAVADMPLQGYEGDEFQAIVPGKIFEDVTKLALDDESVTIGFSDNQIVFQFGSTVLVSRKIEGNYPNYKQLIPAEHAISVKVDTSALVTAIRRVALLAQAHTPVRFRISEADQDVTISARTQDVGGATETIEATVEGDDIEIAFNHQYVLDGLSAIEGDTIIELQTPLKPGIFKSSEDAGFLYLAMPVRLS